MSNIEISSEEYRNLVDAACRLDVIRNAATTYKYKSDLVSLVEAVLGIENKED